MYYIMKTKKIITLLLCFVLMLVNVNSISAQTRHLYHRLELGGGNVWTFVGMEAISMIINEKAGKPISEATLRFSVPCSEDGNLDSFQGFQDWNYDRFAAYTIDEDENTDFASFSLDNLLSNIIIGEKIGYLTDNMGMINFCLYGAAYYNLHRLKRMNDSYNPDDFVRLSMQKLQLGGGLMMILGSIENSNRWIFDAGLRYNLPLQFSAKGYDNKASDTMGKGLSSHYMLKWSSQSATAVGFTFDMLHYDLYKDYNVCGPANIYEFGITLSVLFQ